MVIVNQIDLGILSLDHDKVHIFWEGHKNWYNLTIKLIDSNIVAFWWTPLPGIPIGIQLKNSVLDLFISSGDFPPWTKWRKYVIFWWFNETCQRPRSTQILILMGISRTKIENEASKNIILSSFRSWTKIAGRHEQFYCLQNIFQLFWRKDLTCVSLIWIIWMTPFLVTFPLKVTDNIKTNGYVHFFSRISPKWGNASQPASYNCTQNTNDRAVGARGALAFQFLANHL